MYLTETHIVKSNNELDLITFKCKNLYNKANYTIRQQFIETGRYYNKIKSRYQSELPKNIYSSKKINKLTEKRNNKIIYYLHNSSKWLINYCLNNDLNTIIIGYNEGWKHELNIGKRNNQNFINIPFQRLITMIEESYTSKCSSIDLEDVKKHDIYKGSRIKRGLFKSKEGKIINADVNGSLNILRKAVPNVKFTNGIEAVAVLPKRIKYFK